MDDGDVVETESALPFLQGGIGWKSERLCFFLREEAQMEKPLDLLVPQGGSAKRGLMDDGDVVETDSALPFPQGGIGWKSERLCCFVREEAQMEKPLDLLVPQGGSAKRGLMDDVDVVETDTALPFPQGGIGWKSELLCFLKEEAQM
ncbi:hypothetical protein Y032_0036g3241 [Ancylostoma ceylanicum]|uniref:Uncharacterized protein n=1 Tax=Ancylostoma ceylanicum TaxID=53326 RepID=A0A016UJR5_9BILA|nr:hypothetical protein Y032_0036g3241 [Ancylostoma ceylanicum]